MVDKIHQQGLAKHQQSREHRCILFANFGGFSKSAFYISFFFQRQIFSIAKKNFPNIWMNDPLVIYLRNLYISMSGNEFIKGTLKTIILKLLAQKKRMYGYEITQRVAQLSNDEIKLTYGALYPTLYKLEAEGLLVTTTEVVENRARKYYSLTTKGRKFAKEKVSELQRFNEILSAILADKPKPDLTFDAWS